MQTQDKTLYFPFRIDLKFLNMRKAIHGTLSKRPSVTTVIETLPTIKKPNKKPWMTEEILKNMKERQEIKDRRSDEYRKKANMLRRKCGNAKEIWLNEQCSEIERMKLTNPKEMYDRIKVLSGRNSQTCSGCIRAKDGRIFVDDEDIMKRWTEFIAELFEDDRRERPIIKRNMDGPQIVE